MNTEKSFLSILLFWGKIFKIGCIKNTSKSQNARDNNNNKNRYMVCILAFFLRWYIIFNQLFFSLTVNWKWGENSWIHWLSKKELFKGLEIFFENNVYFLKKKKKVKKPYFEDFKVIQTTFVWKVVIYFAANYYKLISI